MAHEIRAVIFDMDGLLVNSEPLINAAAIAMFQEKGLAVQPEDFLPFVGAGGGPLYWRCGREVSFSFGWTAGQEKDL